MGVGKLVGVGVGAGAGEWVGVAAPQAVARTRAGSRAKNVVTCCAILGSRI